MFTKSQVHYSLVSGEWNDNLKGEFLWSSVNTREATPDVTTPYTWSALRLGFSQMIILSGYSPVGNICGRVYNNASVGATAFQALGRRNSFDASSKELYGIDPNDVGSWNVPLIPVSWRDRVLEFRNVLQIMGKVRNALRVSISLWTPIPAGARYNIVCCPITGRKNSFAGLASCSCPI